ncbi:hypothetical protein AXG93_613s1020 [Marchantia polymorpha subsp. ruderalis]|uniref:Uncharacterized protein n=1 Tax=Marchantia polymorpha subsp. ruderalis TaxID=1480154 RepID=A0A176VND0_MARPO|nr:hypothetical protein AXG93_613s1020 [Marchantia polymorpha subsp. ruderalis]
MTAAEGRRGTANRGPQGALSRPQSQEAQRQARPSADTEHERIGRDGDGDGEPPEGVRVDAMHVDIGPNDESGHALYCYFHPVLSRTYALECGRSVSALLSDRQFDSTRRPMPVIDSSSGVQAFLFRIILPYAGSLVLFRYSEIFDVNAVNGELNLVASHRHTLKLN